MTFRYSTDSKSDGVFVRGNFNNWERQEEYRMKLVP